MGVATLSPAQPQKPVKLLLTELLQTKPDPFADQFHRFR